MPDSAVFLITVLHQVQVLMKCQNRLQVKTVMQKLQLFNLRRRDPLKSTSVQTLQSLAPLTIIYNTIKEPLSISFQVVPRTIFSSSREPSRDSKRNNTVWIGTLRIRAQQRSLQQLQRQIATRTWALVLTISQMSLTCYRGR